MVVYGGGGDTGRTLGLLRCVVTGLSLGLRPMGAGVIDV